MIDLMSIVRDNIHTVGWTGVLSYVGWLWKKSLRAAEKEKAGEQAIAQINKMATNEFPHMQDSLAQLNDKHDESIRLLTSMDKNIALLVDRTPRN